MEKKTGAKQEGESDLVCKGAIGPTGYHGTILHTAQQISSWTHKLKC